MIVLLLLAVSSAQAEPINTTCPVKGERYKVKAIHRLVHEKQLIGFC